MVNNFMNCCVWLVIIWNFSIDFMNFSIDKNIIIIDLAMMMILMLASN